MTEEEKDKLVAEAIVKNCPPNRWVDFALNIKEIKYKKEYPSVPAIVGKDDKEELKSLLGYDLSKLTIQMDREDMIGIVDAAVGCIEGLIDLCLSYGFDPTPHMEELQRYVMDDMREGREAEAAHIKEILIAQGWKE